MDKQEFILNGKTVELEEADYICSIIFRELHKQIEEQLVLYRNCLDKVETLDEGEIKRYIGKIKTTHAIDEYMNEFLEEVTDYASMDDLDKICNEIRNIYMMAGAIIGDYFKDNKNFAVCSCDIDKNIQDSGKRNLKAFYEKRVKDNDPKVRGLSFDDYCNRESFDFTDEVLEAYQLGSYFSTGGIEIADFLNKYADLAPNLSEIEDVIKMCEKVVWLKDIVNRKMLIEQFEYECIYYILLVLKDLNQKCRIPIPKKHYDWENFEEFNNAYKFQCKNDNAYSSTKDEVVENLLRFPFLNKQYNLVLRLIGDTDQELEKFADTLKIDLQPIKEAEITRFVTARKNVDMEDEGQVQKVYKEICQYRKFLGYSRVSELENKLNERLKEFDIIHRTVNGKLYDTLEQAEEVRSRSFEGKEYTSREYAETVKREIKEIRSAFLDKSTLEKYRIHKKLKIQTWQTEEASEELNKIENGIKAEYSELKEKADSIPEQEKKLKQRGLIAGVFVLGSFIYDADIGIVVLIIAANVIYLAYKKLKVYQKAQRDYLVINQEVFQNERDYTENQELAHNKPSGEALFCGKCGNPMDSEMKFCPICGERKGNRKDGN